MFRGQLILKRPRRGEEKRRGEEEKRGEEKRREEEKRKEMKRRLEGKRVSYVMLACYFRVFGVNNFYFCNIAYGYTLCSSLLLVE